MPITGWDDSLALGIPEIDRQHQTLIGYLNELHDAANRDDRDAVAYALLDKLRLYAREHFALEETLMQNHQDPNYDDHRVEHLFFIGKLVSLDINSATAKKTYEPMLNFLVKWFIKHIRSTDQTLRSGPTP